MEVCDLEHSYCCVCIIFHWVDMKKNLGIIIFPSSGAVSGQGVSEDNLPPRVPYN